VPEQASRYFFPRTHRLTCEHEFKRVFATSLKSVDAFFTVLAARNEFDHARLGMVVSKKKVGNAVQRNRIKRIIRESFRLRQFPLLHLDLVVIARNGIAEQSNPILFSALSLHWRRLQRQCEQFF